jgi:signal peptidase I
MSSSAQPWPPLAGTRMAALHARREGVRRRVAAVLRRLLATTTACLVVTLALLAVRTLVADVFRVPSASMAPTLAVDDLILVDRLTYWMGVPRHGDVVVLGSGGLATADLLVKRVVGVPGDVLQARGGVLVRNGAVVLEPHLAPGAATFDFGPVVVPSGHYWVMGDNRPQSQDSRAFGPVPAERLIGRTTGILRALP